MSVYEYRTKGGFYAYKKNSFYGFDTSYDGGIKYSEF